MKGPWKRLGPWAWHRTIYLYHEQTGTAWIIWNPLRKHWVFWVGRRWGYSRSLECCKDTADQYLTELGE